MFDCADGSGSARPNFLYDMSADLLAVRVIIYDFAKYTTN
jgi:hypothetical protein